LLESIAKHAGDSRSISTGSEERFKPPELCDEDIVEVRLRMPQAVRLQLQDLARTKRVTMNKQVAEFIDEGFRQASLTDIDGLAPGFWSYLDGKQSRK